MRRVELQVEHFHGNRFLKSRRFRRTNDLIIMGSSPSADIRLVGEDINPIHSAIEFNGNDWILFDLASPTGTRVNGQLVIEEKITPETVISIGSHELHLMPKEFKNNLFRRQSDVTGGRAGEDQENERRRSEEIADLLKTYHQVVIRRNNMIVESQLLPKGQAYEFLFGKEKKLLESPHTTSWQRHEFGTFEIQQRLVTARDLLLEKKKVELTKNDKLGLIIAGTLSLLIFIGVIITEFSGTEEVAKKEFKENKFSKMIYDAKLTEAKKKSSYKVVKSIKKKTDTKKTNKIQPKKIAKAASSKSDQPKAKKRLVTNIRKAGLGKLIGRISKRANRSLSIGAKIGQRKSQSEFRGSGRAVASVASVNAKLGNGNVKGSRYKLAAVGTKGKGGGVSSFKGLGGLSAGNVASGDVGIIEEETEIQGGLERDVIARYIKSQLGQIRYCYERQLSANPDLYGKVQVKFTIGSTGRVTTQNIGLTTLKSAMVEGCILRRVAKWQFPTPKGGTQVKVKYPFLFKSTN